SLVICPRSRRHAIVVPNGSALSAFCVSPYADHRALHSFPTRRSSDLSLWRTRFESDPGVVGRTVRLGAADATIVGVMPEGFGHRSEEHTSELQSRENLVCRLLLEKKKMSCDPRHHWASGVSVLPRACD